MWDKLSMKEKAAFIRTAVKNGIYNLDDIRNRYNKFAEGGHIYDGTTEESQQMEPTFWGGTLPEVEITAPKVDPNLIHLIGRPEYEGTITQAEDVSPIKRAINNYFRKAKYIANEGKVPGGEYTIPAIAAVAAVPGAIKSLIEPYIAAYTSNGLTGVALTGAGNAIKDAVGAYIGSKVAKPITKNLDPIPATITEGALMGAGASKMKKHADNIERRALETVMRRSPYFDGLEGLGSDIKRTLTNPKKAKAVLNYVFTGKKTGQKGFYNNLADDSPYTGITGDKMIEAPDMIDAYLYGEEVQGLKRVAKGKDFGVHEEDILEHYPTKAKDIQVYELPSSVDIPSDDPRLIYPSDWRGAEFSPVDFYSKRGSINVAGHLYQLGQIGTDQIVRGQDLWKFNPRDYYKKWIEEAVGDIPLWKKALYKVGLHETDRLGTPVITRTNWQNLHPIYKDTGAAAPPPDDWEDLAFKNGGHLFQKGGGLKGGKRAGDKVNTTQCATWSNGLLRDNGYLISGNAWGLNHADMLFNGFDGLEKPEVYNRAEVENYNHNAAGNVYTNFKSGTLNKNKPYVVNMYYNGSPAQEEAYKNGKGVTGTHTGILTHDGKEWKVTHNIHGTIHEEPFFSLQRGDNNYGVTAIYEPREDNLVNRIKGFLGFKYGGYLTM